MTRNSLRRPRQQGMAAPRRAADPLTAETGHGQRPPRSSSSSSSTAASAPSTSSDPLDAQGAEAGEQPLSSDGATITTAADRPDAAVAVGGSGQGGRSIGANWNMRRRSQRMERCSRPSNQAIPVAAGGKPTQGMGPAACWS